MKYYRIDDLIKDLEKFKKEYGNLPVTNCGFLHDKNCLTHRFKPKLHETDLVYVSKGFKIIQNKKMKKYIKV